MRYRMEEWPCDFCDKPHAMNKRRQRDSVYCPSLALRVYSREALRFRVAAAV